MAVSGNYLAGRDAFDGNGQLNGRYLPITGGILSRFVPLQWEVEPVGGAITTGGYVRRADDVPAAAMRSTFGEPRPGFTAEAIRNILSPQGFYAKVEAGFRTNIEQNQLVAMDLMTSLASNMPIVKLVKILSQQEPWPSDGKVFQVFITIEQMHSTLPNWWNLRGNILSRAPKFSNFVLNRDSCLVTAISYYGIELSGGLLDTGTLLDFTGHGFLLAAPAVSRSVMEIDQAGSRILVKTNPSYTAAAKASFNTQPDAEGDWNDVMTWSDYTGPNVPADFFFKKPGYPHVYNPTFAINWLGLSSEPGQPAVDFSYPRIYDYQFRAGSLGGWRVGMI